MRKSRRVWWTLGGALIAVALVPRADAIEPVTNPLRSSDATTATRALASLRTQVADEEIPPGDEFVPPPSDTFDDTMGDFPPLPPDPYAGEHEVLPPLSRELWHHGGSQLYQPEGDRLNWPEEGHYHVMRLPETFEEPQPITAFSEFQGADPIYTRPWLKWLGHGGHMWDLRFVGYGRYSLFAFALEENGRRQDVVGHQLELDLDLRLTGTDRFHVQFRPLGEDNSGGSFYQFSNPSGYADNSTAEPTRYWFEGELSSILGGDLGPFNSLDYNVVVGKFPFALHNSLLLNDEMLGVVLSKNTIYAGPLSNLNIQAFYGIRDINAFTDGDAGLYGVHVSADYRRTFYEATYAYLQHEFDETRNAHFAGTSRTTFFGPLTVATRSLHKWGDDGGTGDGHLVTIESNYTRQLLTQRLGVEEAVFYCNGFYASRGWNPISGGNLNRLRTAFETNPLVRIAAGRSPGNNWGVALGAQLFRHHRDESIVPEVAFESPDGESVLGVGLRYQRKMGVRSYFEALGSFAFSDDPRYEREGVFTTYNIVF